MSRESRNDSGVFIPNENTSEALELSDENPGGAGTYCSEENILDF